MTSLRQCIASVSTYTATTQVIVLSFAFSVLGVATREPPCISCIAFYAVGDIDARVIKNQTEGDIDKHSLQTFSRMIFSWLFFTVVCNLFSFAFFLFFKKEHESVIRF